jgi:polyhydroxyalkanoate synthesis regulator phasin
MPQPKRQSSRSRSTAKKRSSPQRRSSSATGSGTRRSTGQRRTTGQRRSAATAARPDATGPVQQVVEVLGRGVVVTRDRLQESLDDAVKRGRLTRTDANDLLLEILRRGRKQTEDVLADIEQLLGRSRDRALREVDRVRRVTGVANFPVLNYDELTAGQVAERLNDLTPAQLRKVRDYERRNANRKSVLDAIEKALG